jgi:hypothetical protein
VTPPVVSRRVPRACVSSALTTNLHRVDDTPDGLLVGATPLQDRLPEKMRSMVASRMRRAYHADCALAAEAELAALAAELDKTHPGAAASLREGMAETLTVG